MKKWYCKLKESENYNVLIGAVALSILCLCIMELIVSVTGISIGLIRLHGTESVEWARQLLLFRLVSSVVTVLLFMGCLLLVRAACNRNSKLIIPAIVLFILIDIFSYGEAFASANCAIVSAVWFVSTRKKDADILKWSKRVIALLVILTLIKIPCIAIIGFQGMTGLVPGDYIWEFIRLAGSCFVNPEFFLVLLLWKTQKESGEGKALLKGIAVVWVIVIGAWVFTNAQAVLQEPAVGYWSDEEPVTEMEAGDWSGWTTQDEDGNIVYIDEDGNSSTYETFEFE